jgi:bisphosphoglycerate-independent phosphoglycerate mutase (AlkP superfamily)
MYSASETKSGMHHPDGILWIHRPKSKHKVSNERVPLVNIAPTVLDILDLNAPEPMRGRVLT